MIRRVNQDRHKSGEDLQKGKKLVFVKKCKTFTQKELHEYSITCLDNPLGKPTGSMSNLRDGSTIVLAL